MYGSDRPCHRDISTGAGLKTNNLLGHGIINCSSFDTSMACGLFTSTGTLNFPRGI